MAEADYYAVLELKPNASQRELRAQFRRLALQWHPDHNADPAAVPKFRELTEAYEVLRVPERRRAYDERRMLRVPARTKPRPKNAKAGRAALSWVEEFFIQAGGIEAEGPGKGSLRRYTAADLDAVWRSIAQRLGMHGEVRLSIRQYELVLHYVKRHPEIELPADAPRRLAEKHALLFELEDWRRGGLPWDGAPHSLHDLLRRQRFAEARSYLVWRAARSLSVRLAEAGLFEPVVPQSAPLRELSMVDRLEAIAAGDVPERRLGHGYTACRACGGWALAWGVGVPRCVVCGSRRFVLRPRDERDDWLQALIGRHGAPFWKQENVRRAAVAQGVERWVWAPAFLIVALVATIPAFVWGPVAWSWLVVLWLGVAWFGAAWSLADAVPGDTDVLFPDEWEFLRSLFHFAGRLAGVLILLPAAMAGWQRAGWLALLFMGAALLIGQMPNIRMHIVKW